MSTQLLNIKNVWGSSLLNSELPLFYLKRKVKLTDLPRESVSQNQQYGYDKSRVVKFSGNGLQDNDYMYFYATRNVYSYTLQRDDMDIVSLSMLPNIDEITVTYKDKNTVQFNVPTNKDFSNFYVYVYTASLYGEELPDIGFGLEIYNEKGARIFNSAPRQYMTNLFGNTRLGVDFISGADKPWDNVLKTSDVESVVIPVIPYYDMPCCIYFHIYNTTDLPNRYYFETIIGYIHNNYNGFLQSEENNHFYICKDYVRPSDYDVDNRYYLLTVGKPINQSYLVYNALYQQDFDGKIDGIGDVTNPIKRRTTGLFKVARGQTVRIKYFADGEDDMYIYSPTPDVEILLDNDEVLPGYEADFVIKGILISVVQTQHQTIYVRYSGNGKEYTKSFGATSGSTWTARIVADNGYTAGALNVKSGTVTGNVTITASPATLRLFTVSIVQVAHCTVTVHCNGKDYTSTFQAEYGTPWKVSTKVDDGYVSNGGITIQNANGEHIFGISGVVEGDMTFYGRTPTAIRLFTIPTTEHQTITVTVKRGITYTYTSTFRVEDGYTWTATVTADDGYLPGTLNVASGTITGDVTLTITPAKRVLGLAGQTMVQVVEIDSRNNGAKYTFYDGYGNAVPSTTANVVYYTVEGTPSFSKYLIIYDVLQGTWYPTMKWSNNNIYCGATGDGVENTRKAMAQYMTTILSGEIWATIYSLNLLNKGDGQPENWFIPSVSDVQGKYSFLKNYISDTTWLSTERDASNAYYASVEYNSSIGASVANFGVDSKQSGKKFLACRLI